MNKKTLRILQSLVNATAFIDQINTKHTFTDDDSLNGAVLEAADELITKLAALKTKLKPAKTKK